MSTKVNVLAKGLLLALPQSDNQLIYFGDKSHCKSRTG